MKRLQKTCMTAILIGCFTSISFGQAKIAQTGFNFLSVSADARSSGMGDAVNSLSGFSGSMFYNPASMAEMSTILGATASVHNWIADIDYLSFSAILSPSSGDYGNIGVSVQAVNYGEVEGTIVDRNSPSGYMELDIMKPTALAVGVGYAKMLNDKFGVGGRIKYVTQSLGESNFMSSEGEVTTKKNKAEAFAFDFGTVYKTGIKSIAFGMSVTNFSKEVKYEEEGFQLPLLFTIGMSANVLDFIDLTESDHELMLSVDWTHPRSHPEQLKIGMEYQFMKLISLRGGYIGGNDENDFTVGVGVSHFGFGFDYSYIPFGVFGNVQQFTARFSM